MTKKELIKEIEKNPKYQHALNNIIMDIYKNMGLEINKEGPDSQIDFLEQEGFTLKQIFEKIHK